ncbi:MAG: hypothetical protein HXX10_28150 [Rhodoplanes sp.]|uniref:hypothetical protein n=1 Tax=Rhodoplanes sp. TaxID=1968906 RepID=UPI001856B3F9|nr:hypothetical protein [Rhodoplanes sp.]NVO17911.1 hypothetical protein [Rhodoplanes sp.]
MKRSNTVTLALMGTASFAASFAAGSAFLAWTKPATPPAAAVAAGPAAAQVAAAVPVGSAASRPTCTIRPDGSQSCPSSSSWTTAHVWGPAWLYPSGMRGGSATATNLVSTGAQAFGPSRTGLPDGAARGGFGSTSRGMAHASAAS